MNELVGAMLALVVLIALGAVFWLRAGVKSWRRARITVPDGHQGLRIRRGSVVETLGPGLYSTWLSEDRIDLFDLRLRTMSLAGQELLTRDLLPVRLSIILRYRIAEPTVWRSASDAPFALLYEDVQLELRRRVAGRDIEDLMKERDTLVAGFAEAVSPRAKALGFEVSSVELRDVVLAGPAKQAYADLWKAKKEGEAALERARGEQASLRSLANAARMLKGNPELMNLRLLQALAGGPGRPAPTIVLGGGAGLLPVAGAAPPDAPGAVDE